MNLLTSVDECIANQCPELLDKCINELALGKIEAMEPLYQSTSTSVYSFALSILKNAQDAEDVLQDTFINIYTGSNNYQSSGKPLAWILTITKNLSLRKLQQKKLISDIPQEDWEPYYKKDQGLTQEDKIVITDTINLLSDTERQVVILHAVSGFKHREIAEILELKLPTVLSKYHRATKKMKEILG